jgi:K+/H+ antiporter YhaU regulatory subunit KhtT
MPDVHVLAERLPGVGWRYTVPADQSRQVMVMVEDRGPVHLILTDPRLDEPLTTVRLSAAHASVLAALMTGARFTLETPEAARVTTAPDPTEVVVETLTVPSGSPALGRAPVDVVQPAGAVLLGVICDATPQLVETDVRRGVRVGDKLVVASRRGRLSRLRGAV